MTTTEQNSEIETFQKCLWNLYGQLPKEDPLAKARAKAWDFFLTEGAPDRNNEVYRYIRLRNFYAHGFVLPSPIQDPKELPIVPECAESVLVYLNGVFSPTLSRTKHLPQKIVIAPISEAINTYGSFLNNQWTKALKDEADPFARLNLALQQEGAFLYVPPKTVVEHPIQILQLIDAKSSPYLMNPRLQIFVGAQSEISLLQTWHVMSGTTFGINSATDLAIEENAHVKFDQIAYDLPDTLWQFDALRATLKRDSTLKTVCLTNGAATIRQDYRVSLAGEGAEASLNGLLALNAKREAHIHILMDHQAPNCRSMQLFKSALDGASRSSFEGKIYVHQAAQKTEAFQLNNNLLLSDQAHADSKPNLEIFADDVKASHGATIGQLDKEQIFYMKTRGYNEKQATSLLVKGFCKEVIDMAATETIRHRIEKKIEGL